MAATRQEGDGMTSQNEPIEGTNSEHQQLSYAKMSGFATMEGQNYEIKMAALLYVRAINSGREFQLATNVKGAGALDDIVFKVRTPGQLWQSCFVQLKHKKSAKVNKDSLVTLKGNFYLSKYFESFMDIKQMFKSEEQRVLKLEEGDGLHSGEEVEISELFSGNFDSCHFAIFTNAELEALGEFLEKRDLSNPVDKFIKLNDVDANFTDHFVESIYSNLLTEEGKQKKQPKYSLRSNEEDAKVFLRKVKLFTGQPSEDQLDDVIKEELKKYYTDLGEEYIDIMFPKYYDKFKMWWEGEVGVILGNYSSILNNVLQQAKAEQQLLGIKTLVEALVLEQVQKFKLKNFKFLENLTASLKDACADQHSLVNVVAKESVRITTNKVLQFLEDRNDPCIIMGTESLLKQRQAVMSGWRHGKKHLLVIVSEERANPELDRICTEISQVLKEGKDKRIVLVSPPCDSFARRLEEKMGTKFTIIPDSFHLEQLDQESIDVILQKKVTFQGQSTTLGMILGSDLDRISTELKTVLKTIIASESFVIGDKLQEDIEYYVPRTLQCKNIVDNKVFLDKKYAGRIIIQGAALADVDTFVSSPEQIYRIKNKFQQIDEGLEFNARDEDNEDRDTNTRDDVHYFDWIGGKLVWKKTQGNIDSIKKYIDANESNTILDPDSRVVLLIAEPGMGKTTSLAHETQQVKAAHPGLWVVCVALNDHATLLAEVEKGELNAEQFLSSALGVDTVLERDLLSYSLNHTGRIITLLDGFDEISPRYTDVCLTLINSFLKTRIKQIWISSRFAMKNILETQLSTLALTLRKFSIEDQKIFLEKYWRASTCHSSEVIQEYISRLLDKASQAVNDKERDFTGIPLQSRMLAEVFQDSITKADDIIIPESLNVLQLIEQFVDKKFKTYFKRTVKLHESSPEYEYEFEDKRYMFIEKHITASFVLLVDESDLQSLRSLNIGQSRKFFEDIKKGIDKTGIIDRVVDGKPVFLHRVFAEYFAALWFSEHYLSNTEFMSKLVLSETFGVVRHIFDRILARENELHNAVLSADKARVEAMLSNGSDVNSTDKGGRTALHLSVMAGLHNPSEEKQNIPIIELLMTHNAGVDVKDNVLHLTPVRYADVSELWAEMDMLLKHGCFDISQFITTKQHIDDKDMWENIVKHDYAKVLSLLFELSEHRNIQPSNESRKRSKVKVVDFMRPETILLQSAEFGSAEVARHLIDRASGVTSRTTNQPDASSSKMTSLCHWRALNKLQNARRGRANRNALMIASQHNHIAVVRTILESFEKPEDLSGYIDKCDTLGRSALWIASSAGCNDIVDLLIASGAYVTDADNDGWTGLMEASYSGHVSVVRSLLTSFNDEIKKAQFVNTLDKHGTSALSLACSRGHSDILDSLIAGGADVTARDKDDRTGLMEASYGGHVSVVRTLLDTFNDESKQSEYVNLRDDEGKSSLWFATRYEHPDIIDLLIKAGATE